MHSTQRDFTGRQARIAAQIRYHITTYARLLSIQLHAQMQYRIAFLLQTAAAGISLFMFFVSLALVFERFGNLAGWTLGEVAFLWGTVEVSFGIMQMLFSGFDPGNFGQRVRRGTFDQLLLRPVNISVQVLGDRFELHRLGRLLQGILIFVIAVNLADITWTMSKIIYIPLILLGLICYFGGLFIVGSTITFWTVESIEAINILTYGGSEMMSYPMHIYPDWLRRTFTYIVPAIFLNYYPALYILNKPDPFGFPPFVMFISPLVGFTLLLGALAFWRFGIRHYQSTGT